MPKLCKCGAIVNGACARCNPMHNGKTTAERGYDSQWKKLSERYRVENPLCCECDKLGIATPATEVHHCIPIKHAPHLRLEPSNLMSVCRACHERIEGKAEPPTQGVVEMCTGHFSATARSASKNIHKIGGLEHGSR